MRRSSRIAGVKIAKPLDIPEVIIEEEFTMAPKLDINIALKLVKPETNDDATFWCQSFNRGTNNNIYYNRQNRGYFGNRPWNRPQNRSANNSDRNFYQSRPTRSFTNRGGRRPFRSRPYHNSYNSRSGYQYGPQSANNTNHNINLADTNNSENNPTPDNSIDSVDIQNLFR